MVNTDTTTLTVHTTVLYASDGGGNPLWEPEWIDAMLATATTLVQHAVTFRQAPLSMGLAEDATYALNQTQLLARFLRSRAPRRLTLVISRPNTEDTAGLALQGPQLRPIIVMRARGDALTLDAIARIFLHEVAHCAGVLESDAETIQDTEIGRALLRAWVTSVNAGKGDD
jgi:hypothetical protein